jgi:hypothetical protein
MHPVDNSIQVGRMSAIITVTEVLNRHRTLYQLLPERSAPMSAVRGRNVILVGDPQDSNVATTLLEKTPFTIAYDAASDDLAGLDRRNNTLYRPKRGQDKRYSDVYGLITVLPSPGGKANERVVILSGITSVGSQGAAEYFASEREMSGLRKRFQAEGLAGFPPAYQVLVHCKSNDTLLVSFEYETHTTIRN